MTVDTLQFPHLANEKNEDWSVLGVHTRISLVLSLSPAALYDRPNKTLKYLRIKCVRVIHRWKGTRGHLRFDYLGIQSIFLFQDTIAFCVNTKAKLEENELFNSGLFRLSREIHAPDAKCVVSVKHA